MPEEKRKERTYEGLLPKQPSSADLFNPQPARQDKTGFLVTKTSTLRFMGEARTLISKMTNELINSIDVDWMRSLADDPGRPIFHQNSALWTESLKNKHQEHMQNLEEKVSGRLQEMLEKLDKKEQTKCLEHFLNAIKAAGTCREEFRYYFLSLAGKVLEENGGNSETGKFEFLDRVVGSAASLKNRYGNNPFGALIEKQYCNSIKPGGGVPEDLPTITKALSVLNETEKQVFEIMAEKIQTLGFDNVEHVAAFCLSDGCRRLMARIASSKDRFGEGLRSITGRTFQEFVKSSNTMEELTSALKLSAEFRDDELAGFFALYHCESVTKSAESVRKMRKALNFSEETPPEYYQIKKMLSVMEKLDLQTYHRYSPKMLENIYRTATEAAFSDGKRLACVVLPKSDYNNVAGGEAHLYESLIDHGYNLVMCETAKDVDVIRRFLNNGMEPGNTSAVGSRTYDLAVFEAHGTINAMAYDYTEDNFRSLLGPLLDEGGRLTPGDISKVSQEVVEKYKKYPGMVEEKDKYFQPGIMAPKLSKKATVCLFSCFSGADIYDEMVSAVKGNADKENRTETYLELGNNILSIFMFLDLEFRNTMEGISELANKEGDGKVAKVCAAETSTSARKFIFDEDGFAEGVEYYRGATKEYAPIKK